MEGHLPAQATELSRALKSLCRLRSLSEANLAPRVRSLALSAAGAFRQRLVAAVATLQTLSDAEGRFTFRLPRFER